MLPVSGQAMVEAGPYSEDTDVSSFIKVWLNCYKPMIISVESVKLTVEVYGACWRHLTQCGWLPLVSYC